MSLENAYRLAGRKLGMNETEQNAALSEFMRNGGVNLDPAVTAWCAGFVNASLQQAGLEGTNSLAARSFENWGVPTQNPQRGDLAVFRRGDEDWMGHVGFFHGFDDDGNILVLGGNQGNAVSIRPYNRNALLSFRTQEGREPFNEGGGPIAGAFGFGGQQPTGQPQQPMGQPQPQNALAQFQQAQAMMQQFKPRNSLDPAMFRNPEMFL